MFLFYRIYLWSIDFNLYFFSEPPLIGPNVTTDRMTYVGGDHIRANCTSPPSLPAANITWYVNEQMVSGQCQCLIAVNYSTRQ